MTDIKKPDEGFGAQRTVGQGVRVIRRRIHTVGLGAVVEGGTSPSTAPIEQAAQPAVSPVEYTGLPPSSDVAALEFLDVAAVTSAPVQGSGYVLHMVEELSADHTAYATEGGAGFEQVGDVALDPFTPVEFVIPDEEKALPVGKEKAMPTDERPKVVRLFTQHTLPLRSVSPDEAASDELVTLHDYAIKVAEYCVFLYVQIMGPTAKLSSKIFFQDARHVNLVTPEGRRLSVQVRIKPFGKRIEVAFQLMQRHERKSGTFMPAPDNVPVGFSFPRSFDDKTIMVSGEVSKSWFALALAEFVKKMAEDSNIILGAKERE